MKMRKQVFFFGVKCAVAAKEKEVGERVERHKLISLHLKLNLNVTLRL